MQSSDRVLAWRYGRALFQAAAETGHDEEVSAELSGVHGLILDLEPVLKNPRVSTSDKKKRLGEALKGRVSDLTMRFLELLIDKKRFNLLPLVGANIVRLIAERKNLVKASVRSAWKLSPEEQAKLKERLERFAGKDVELDLREDPEVIGGLVVRLGDWVLDSSLRGQLRSMKEALNGY